MRSRSPSTREARADQIKGNCGPWAVGSVTRGLPTALLQHKKNGEDWARICFFKGFKQMLILLRQKVRCVWPTFLGRDGGRAQPDTPVIRPPSQGCGSPYTRAPTGHSRRAADSTVLVPHSPQAPSQGLRERSSPRWAQPCGQLLLQSKPSSPQTSPFIRPAARSSRFPSKAL